MSHCFHFDIKSMFWNDTSHFVKNGDFCEVSRNITIQNNTNSPMIVRSTMGVLLPRTQINLMLRDVTWRDVTQHFLHAVPLLNYLDTFGLYGLHVQDLTVAQQIFMLDEKIQIQKKEELTFYKRTPMIEKEIFTLFSTYLLNPAAGLWWSHWY